MEEVYKRALKLGEQDSRRAAAHSRHPYLTDLDSLIGDISKGARKRIGLVEIPLDMVVGTVTTGRQTAFSRNFMPLLASDSEFAHKWCNLYKIQVTEGYRDPIQVVEYMHRFYVQEGNKRVSVLKYLDAPTVMAYVDRLYPLESEDSPEERRYAEFCRFWNVCPIYEIEFSQEGGYKRLAEMLGQDLEHPWPDQTVEYLRQSFTFFKQCYLRAGGDHLDITPADAMLLYSSLYTQDRLLDVASSIVINRLGKIWRELATEGKSVGEKIALVESADDEGKKPSTASTLFTPARGVLSLFMGKTVYSPTHPLRVAFIHEKPVALSAWVHVHDLGRQHLERYFGGIVQTQVYEDRHTEDSFNAAVKLAVSKGVDVIFSTSHTLMDYTVRASVEYPDVRFLNCSIGLPHQSVRSYFGKMYEAKFLLGALAANMAKNHRIGYRATVLASGAPTEINAFAIGASLVDSQAKVILSWGEGWDNDIASYMRDENLTVMSCADVALPYGEQGAFGLYLLNEDGVESIANPVWHWDRYYELIVRSLLHGTWNDVAPEDPNRAVSYWYGLRSGVIDVECSENLPYTTRKLVQLLRNGILDGAVHPFEGELHSQDGVVQPAGTPPMQSVDVVSMMWLADNVEGELPEVEPTSEVSML